MIQKLILFSLCLLPFSGFSGIKESIPKLWVIKDSASKFIHRDSIKFVVRVFDYNNQLQLDQHPAIIQVNMDKKIRRQTITAKNSSFKYTLPKGRHAIQFYLNPNFETIRFDQELSGGRYIEIGISFAPKGDYNQIMVEKPVIYLYSEQEENFALKVHTDAAIQFTYPAYEEAWKGSSSPDGMIRMNGNTYPYLFWDASLNPEKLRLNWSNADVIEGTEAVSYLENQLNRIGFNTKEKADFITYWGPRIQQLKYAEICWFQDEAINEIASLEISPAFKTNRVYLVFRESDQLIEQSLQLRIPSLKPMNRSGNYLIEWGGIEMTNAIN